MSAIFRFFLKLLAFFLGVLLGIVLVFFQPIVWAIVFLAFILLLLMVSP